jgi:hypothetical protein
MDFELSGFGSRTLPKSGAWSLQSSTAQVHALRGARAAVTARILAASSREDRIDVSREVERGRDAAIRGAARLPVRTRPTSSTAAVVAARLARALPRARHHASRTPLVAAYGGVSICSTPASASRARFHQRICWIVVPSASGRTDNSTETANRFLNIEQQLPTRASPFLARAGT